MKLKDLVKLKPIIEAIEQGKTIQFKNVDAWYSVDYEDIWFSIHGLMRGEIEWRIKPEPPREWSVLVDSFGEIVSTSKDGFIFSDETFDDDDLQVIKVREVIE